MRSVSDALRCAQEQPEKRGEAENGSGSGRPGAANSCEKGPAVGRYGNVPLVHPTVGG